MEFVKLPPDIPEYKSIEYLLDNSIASKFATPFIIGSNKVTIYGFPLIMRAKSPVLEKIAWQEFLTPRGVQLASTFELSKENAPGFVIVWAYLNGLINADTVVDLKEYSFDDLMHMLEWVKYFNIDSKSWIYDIIVNEEIVKRLEMIIIERTKSVIQILTPEQQKSLIREALSNINSNLIDQILKLHAYDHKYFSNENIKKLDDAIEAWIPPLVPITN